MFIKEGGVILKVVLQISDEEYAPELMAEGLFYIVRDRIEKYVNENNLTIKEKAIIYEYLIKEIEKDINK